MPSLNALSRWTLPAAAGLLAVAVRMAVPAPAAAQSLASRLEARLDQPPFDRHLWGVAVADQDGDLLFGRNAERLFIPASNTKLVVTATAAALLPPDFSVATSVYATGPVEAGVVRGDLVLYGRGDPAFSERCYAVDTLEAGACETDPATRLRALAAQLAGAGIREVTGEVVGDGSWFDPVTVHPTWEAYDLAWWYAAPVSGLTFNDNSLKVRSAPGPAPGVPPAISLAPDHGDVTLENRAVTGEPGSRPTFDIVRGAWTREYIALGSVPADAREDIQYLAVADPNLYAARAFRAALEDAGIRVTGGAWSTTDSSRHARARLGAPLAEVRSRPLRDWIFPILNTSQNLFAEVLLKQLGRQFRGVGSWDAGLDVERRFLIDSVGVDSTQFALSDGSGLSSINLVSPLAFTRLLGYMRRHRNWEAFAAGLPQSGRRGSLRLRFIGTPLEGRVRAKTGSISRVNTLSGFVDLPDGSWRVFSVQANHHVLGGRAMIQQIDSVVVELAR
ncbi:MAG TPA: D-alanyl-D-alanine carboxypeptidase/D-alanyl-D-alanine-endopeptidase [Gemmatimonadales bacterium]|nr:D-alanyl-D-alanine carboxypeptidase/D-alanyl-D-alanine-endopeptidase [Gemmatimonadales bacterium]